MLLKPLLEILLHFKKETQLLLSFQNPLLESWGGLSYLWPVMVMARSGLGYAAKDSKDGKTAPLELLPGNLLKIQIPPSVAALEVALECFREV